MVCIVSVWYLVIFYDGTPFREIFETLENEVTENQIFFSYFKEKSEISSYMAGQQPTGSLDIMRQ